MILHYLGHSLGERGPQSPMLGHFSLSVVTLGEESGKLYTLLLLFGGVVDISSIEVAVASIFFALLQLTS